MGSMISRKPKAVCLVRNEPPFRRDAFVAGLRRLGFDVLTIPPGTIRREDVLVTWNRHGAGDAIARRYEAAGSRIIVTENGYLGEDAKGRQMYALALGHHNGGGRWDVGNSDRWSRLGIKLAPWRSSGDHILVLPQRGIGPLGVAMPKPWAREIGRRVAAKTGRPVRIRGHPGRIRTPLEPDLVGAWAVVTWGSSAALRALVAGIPAFFEFERWIGAQAAKFGIDDFEAPVCGDRLPMLQRLAYAQWSIAEIESGEPLARLLELGRA